MVEATEYWSMGSANVAEARLYGTRGEMIMALDVQKGGVIAEIGVAKGELFGFLDF